MAVVAVLRTPALVITGLASLCTLACADAYPSSAMAPSAIIAPDAVTVGVGEAQVFSVRNATVVRFDVAADGQPWSECVEVDAAFGQANALRLVARSRCRGAVYVSAQIGGGRSPLVAVMKVQ